eukprot:gene2790-12665_t
MGCDLGKTCFLKQRMEAWSKGHPQPPPGSHTPSNGQMYGGYGGYQQAQQQRPPAARAGSNQHYPGASSSSQPRQQPPPQEYQKTKTIRNQVNLKKDTLKLQDRWGRRTPQQNALLSQMCGWGSMVRKAPSSCRQGLNMQYTSSLTIPKSKLSAMAAAVEPTSSFNIIVRLEALTDEARAEGRTLDALQPGCSLNTWVQAQTTFAKVAVNEDGGWLLRVLKQKIWFKGSAYELQEIYGMEQGHVGGAVGADGFDNLDGCECVICMSAPRDTTALPCRHMCMCHDCAGALKLQTNKCPICREKIESLLHIKVAKGLPVPAA